MNLRLVGLAAVALFAGSLIPIQTALNANLGRRFGSPVLAGTSSFVVATAFLGLVALLSRPALPELGAFRGMPYATWLGGIIGAAYVLSLIVLAPRIGVGLTTALVVLGQVITGATLDHLGAWGLPEHPFGPARALALALMCTGVLIFKLG